MTKSKKRGAAKKVAKKKSAAKKSLVKKVAKKGEVTLAQVKAALRRLEKAANDPVLRPKGSGGAVPPTGARLLGAPGGAGGGGGQQGDLQYWITYCHTQKRTIGDAGSDFNEVEAGTQAHIHEFNPNHNAETVSA